MSHYESSGIPICLHFLGIFRTPQLTNMASRRGINLRRSKKNRNIENSVRIKACVQRYDTRCSSGTLPITWPACWLPPLTFLRGRRCVCRVTVTWSYQERVGRLVTGLSLLPHPVLGIGCQPTWNSCVRLLLSRTNWRVFCFMLLTPGTLCELWNAPNVGGALQVTVGTVTVTVFQPCIFSHLRGRQERTRRTPY